MVARTTALWIVLLVGCASANKNTMTNNLEEAGRTPGLFVGHSQSGSIVVAANHYDAMSGLATTAEELGIAPRKGAGNNEMRCSREMLTGTHVPQWICRYEEDMRKTRQATVDWLDQPRTRLAVEREQVLAFDQRRA